ncbi:uncharacterized protein [Ptychodera flava]|uniref:uncharacterized protein n=1 Tax=Ptychodera flava TaxID=63121 RepID=UPI00396A5F35
MSLPFPAVSVAVAAIAIILYIVSTATDYWVELTSAPDGKTFIGLWRFCSTLAGTTACTTSLPEEYAKFKDGIWIARGCMLSAILIASITWILTLLALYEKRSGHPRLSFCKTINRFHWKVNGMAFFATVLLVFAGTTVIRAKFDGYVFGYSIILAWISIGIGIISGSMLTFCFPTITDANSPGST